MGACFATLVFSILLGATTRANILVARWGLGEEHCAVFCVAGESQRAGISGSGFRGNKGWELVDIFPVALFSVTILASLYHGLMVGSYGWFPTFISFFSFFIFLLSGNLFSSSLGIASRITVYGGKGESGIV